MSRELDAQVARALGWTEMELRKTPQLFFPGQYDETLYGLDPEGRTPTRVPYFSRDPTTTPTLLAEIERRDLIIMYLAALRRITRDGNVDDWWQDWNLLTATPEQHARAFVEATNATA